MAYLFLVHAAAALALVAISGLPRRVRSRGAVAIALLGTAAAVVLVFVEGDWRTTAIDDDVARVVGAGIACAWVLAAALGPAGERWRTGALVGVASAGLALFAANEWVVPALLFWLVSSVALVLLVSRPRGQGVAALWIGVADAAFVVAVVAFALERETWALDGALTGWPRWLVLASLLARAGAVPRFGVWQSLRSPAAAAMPVAVAGSFVVMARLFGGPSPWVGVALLAAGVAVLALSLLGRALVASTVGAWPVLLMLAAAAISPATVGRAGVAGCLAVALVAAWPSSAGRARIPRGLGIAFLPPFVGFGVVLSAAIAAFDRAADAPTTLGSAPWTGAAAILPLALAGGVVLGLNAALQSRAAPREPAPALVTWALAVAALAAGFLDPGAVGGLGRVRVLYAIAAVVGAAAVYVSLARHHEDEIVAVDEGADATAFDPGLMTLPRRLESAAAWATVVVVAGMATGVGWLTYEGLRNGFLS
ncbi:MAG TPA: hypothetical protein VIG64_03570 [Actinomycetota bacterium]|jgi:hypothetical protein